MEDSDRVRSGKRRRLFLCTRRFHLFKENLHIETLFTQFEIVKNKTNESHVQHYGNLTIAREPVADFQGEADAKPRYALDVSAPKRPASSK